MTDRRQIRPGCLVRSRCGHDAGRLFIIVSVSDDGKEVLYADGMTRKIQKPKRKKVIHIEPYTLPVLDAGAMTNKQAAAAVKGYCASSDLQKG